MDFPDISTFPDEQRMAIENAKRWGESSFLFHGTLFRIERNGDFFKVHAYDWDEIIWLASTWTIGKHYALRVDPEFQWQWIWKILFSTKIALDGILDSEWSGRYSRILFLIKMWYVPENRATNEVDDFFDRPLSPDEQEVVDNGIKLFCSMKRRWWAWDDCPFSVRLKYKPEAARLYLKSLGLDH